MRVSVTVRQKSGAEKADAKDDFDHAMCMAFCRHKT